MENKPNQKKMPETRQALTHEFNISGFKGYLTVGVYEDGKPGEVFVNISKEGSTVSGLLDALSIVTSFALQYGVPLEKLVGKLSHMKFEPSGFTGGEFGYAHSIVDYVFRWLGDRYLPKAQPGAETLDAPTCKDCGAVTVRVEGGYSCPQCGRLTELKKAANPIGS